MRKLLLLAIALLGFSFAQAQQCKIVLEDGSYQGTSYGHYDSTAISKIEWKSYDGAYYAVVYFTSSYQGYTYGGYSYSDYWTVRNAFENAASSGKAFWNYIEPYKVNC